MSGSRHDNLGPLVLQLSAKIGDFDRQLAKASGIAAKRFREINRQARESDRKLEAHFKNMAKRASVAFSGIAAALGVRELSNLADQWSDLNARLSLATGSTHAGADAMERLGQVARRSYSSLENTVESFIANSTALKELGYNTEQQLDYTEALNNALVISGAKGDRAKAVMNALSKAMAGGKLSGQNLNTVIEQGGRVAEALADSMGVSVSKLRELGAAGKIGSKELFGITSQINKLNKELDSMPTTIQDGFVLIKNALLEYVLVGDAALVLAGLIATRLIGRSLLPLIARAKDAGIAIASLMKALRSATGLMAALGGVAGIAGGVASVIGGILVFAMSHYSRKSAEAQAASNKLREEWGKMGLFATEAEDAIDGLANSLDRVGEAGQIRQIKALNDELERMTKVGNVFGFGDGEIEDIIDGLGKVKTGYNDVNDNAVIEAQRLLVTLQTVPASAAQVHEALQKIILRPGVVQEVADLAKQGRQAAAAILDIETAMQSLGTSAYLGSTDKAIDDLGIGLMRLAAGFPEVGQELMKIFDKVRDGTMEVEEFKSAIKGIPEIASRLDHLPFVFDMMTDAIFGARVEADKLLDRVQRTNAIRLAENEQLHSLERVAEQQQHINQFQNDYVKELDAVNAKTREQLELERKIADIKKGYEAKNGEGAAAHIPERMWEEQGRKALEADKRRGEEGKRPRWREERDNDFERLTRQMQERSAALREEAGIVGQLNPLINDYGYAINKATHERQLWAAARKAGVDERDGVAEAIAQISEELAQADVALQKVTESGEKLKSKLEEVKAVSQDVTRTFIDGLIEGKSATEALGDALKRLGNKLLDSGLNALFDGLFKGIGGGGGGGLFSMLFRADGGEVRHKPNGMIRGAGGSRDDVIPTMLSNGEFVVNAAATRKYRALLEQINAGAILHRADGGLVSAVNARMPAIPSPRYLQGLKETRERALRVDVRPSPLFDVKITEISDSRIEKAAPQLVNQAVTQSDSRFSQNYQDVHNRSYL